jgi:hypothetical protein
MFRACAWALTSYEPCSGEKVAIQPVALNRSEFQFVS